METEASPPVSPLRARGDRAVTSWAGCVVIRSEPPPPRPLGDHPVVRLEAGESLDLALRELDRRVNRLGVLRALRLKVGAASPGARRRRKHRVALRRLRREAARQTAAEAGR